MSRQTADQPITTRAARERLATRDEPYWRAIDNGAALGYRKGEAGGFWAVRVLIDGRYRKGSLGRADDALKPDGTAVLDYRQAVESGRAWVTAQHRIVAGQDPRQDSRAAHTVSDALDAYLADYRRRGGKSVAATQQAIGAHIRPALGSLRLDRLSRTRIVAWRNEVADAAPRLRTGKTAKAGQRYREVDPNDADAMRRRRATANRILTILKAALNHAHQSGLIASNDPWAAVKPFGKVDAAKVRHLTDAEAGRLVTACPPDLRQIVTGALLTGMRYGELTRVRMRDFHPENGTLHVPASKSGKARHVVLPDEGRAFFTGAACGKEPGALIFLRADGGAWGKSHQHRPLREACGAAGIAPAISFHILRHTYASRLAMRGIPLPVIAAQLGHEGTRMTERHYAHLTPNYVADTVRSMFGSLGLARAAEEAPSPTALA